ncbi:unnamed protein product, partial [Ixodes hexagonus]
GHLESLGSAPWWDMAHGFGVSVFPLMPLDKEPPVDPENLAATMMRHLGLGPLALVTLGATPGNRSAVSPFLRPPKLQAREPGSAWNHTSGSLQALVERVPEARLVRALLEFQQQLEKVSPTANSLVAPYVPRYRAQRVFSLPQNKKVLSFLSHRAGLNSNVICEQVENSTGILIVFMINKSWTNLSTKRCVFQQILTWTVSRHLSPWLNSSLQSTRLQRGLPLARMVSAMRSIRTWKSASSMLHLIRRIAQRSGGARSRVRELLGRVVDELKHQLVDYLWMQETVSQYAIQKLNGVQAHLLYPSFVEDKMVLDQIYRQVPDMTGQSPLADWFRARSAVMLKRWKALAGKGLSPL